MYQDPEAPIRLPDLPESAGDIQPFPRPVVWTAGLIVALLGVFGLYQGFHGASSRGSGGGRDEEGGSGAISAQAATALPASVQWSTLSGPAMSSPAPKAQSSAAAASNEDEDNSAPESEAPSAQSAAPESAAPQAESAGPTELQVIPNAPQQPSQDQPQ